MKYKLKWVEEVFWEVEVEAKNKKAAEKKFFNWDKEVQGCNEAKTNYISGSLEVEETK